jgi:hypothetical protein
MSSVKNEQIHLIQLGYSLLIVICKFSHFALVCPDIWYDTFLLTSILSVKLLNVTSSCHITSPQHAPHIKRRSHITSKGPLASLDRETKTLLVKGPRGPSLSDCTIFFLTSSKWTKNYHTWVVVPPPCLPISLKPQWDHFELSQKAVSCHCMIMSWSNSRITSKDY